MEVRQFRSDEWRLYRELRLRALADAPRAFASTLAEEQTETDGFWIERTAASPGGTTLLATSEGRPLGMVTVRLQGETLEEGRLLAMWVAPEWRRRGAGRKLIDGAAEWAERRGATWLTLWVTDYNSAGVGLYQDCGFEPTSEPQPLRSHPDVMETAMRRTLL